MLEDYPILRIFNTRLSRHFAPIFYLDWKYFLCEYKIKQKQTKVCRVLVLSYERIINYTYNYV